MFCCMFKSSQSLKVDLFVFRGQLTLEELMQKPFCRNNTVCLVMPDVHNDLKPWVMGWLQDQILSLMDTEHIDYKAAQCSILLH